MARLLSPPHGLKITSIEPLSSPRTVKGGGSQSTGNFTQTTASPFALWRWQFAFAPMVGAEFRQYRGWITGLHGGVNATRFKFVDPDRASHRELGLHTTTDQLRAGISWGNSKPWDVEGADPWFNTGNWKLDIPLAIVHHHAELGANTIHLTSAHWGHKLNIGDYIGFSPFHFGLYTITEVLDVGKYRIWPPLRKTIAVEDFATLEPQIVLRLESEESAKAGRSLQAAEGLVATFVECLDYDVRDYWAD